MKITRRTGLTEAQFVREFLKENLPVIVLDSMSQWPALSGWTPDTFSERFGQEEVQVYNQLFDLIDVQTLKSYFEKNFFKENNEISTEYVRWYTKLKDVDFIWSDAVFDRLQNEWTHPSFLPKSEYIVPYTDEGGISDVTKDNFPYKGLFLSGKGGRTRLHRDPLGTQAILCQLYGRKLVTFYHPSNDSFLRRGAEFVDIRKPDQNKFPNFHKAKVEFEDILEPGEILFVPDNWLHDVTTLEDSISVTWNFVHRARTEPCLRVLEEKSSQNELETMQFFLKDRIKRNAQAEEIISFLRSPPQ